jgi:putative membrane protein (TIGR04086 family)
MEYIKKLGISFIFSLSFLISLTFIFSSLYYINFIGNGLFKFIKILIPIISIFIGSFIIGKKSNSKGWLEGLKFGSIIILLLFFISIIFFRRELSIKIILYYLILLLTSSLSSMIGINFKVVDK